MFLTSLSCRAQVYEKFFSFGEAQAAQDTSDRNIGRNPQSGMILANDGNFYGTTASGGEYGSGTIFRMTPAGELTTLVVFTGNGAINKGRFPNRLMQASDGNLYGTTRTGGSVDSGTIFRVTMSGVLRTLRELQKETTAEGAIPNGALIEGADGKLYGTTTVSYGGGNLFAITKTGRFSHLIPTGVIPATGSFGNPVGALLEASPGVFYGTSSTGRQAFTGGSALGTVFRYTLGSQMEILAGFTGTGGQTPGATPQSTLTKDENGNLYGMARAGGASDYGTIFRVSPSGQTTILVEFTGNGPVNKGRRADRGLLRGRDGNFYGVTYGGGAADLGTVFKMTPAGLLTTLVEFTGDGSTSRGAHPMCDLVQGIDGHFYGTTVGGGIANQGTIFKVTGEGVLTSLVEFNDPISGSAPSGAPRRDPGGQFFYGVTERGGANNMGAVYATTSAGAIRTVANFSGTTEYPRGGMPTGTPVLLQAGGSPSNIYDMIGLTTGGGFWDSGTLYQLSSTDQFTTLFDFDGSNGRGPTGSLLDEFAGLFSSRPPDPYYKSLLGVTSRGGSSDLGTVFRYQSYADGSLRELYTLYHFSGNGSSNKGALPEAGLVRRSNGLYYGCTARGGNGDFGTIYRFDGVGVDLLTVVEFTGNGAMNKGSHPKAEMTLGGDGNLYGATSRGGADDCGTIFRLTPDDVLTTLVEFTGNGATNKGRAPECVLLWNSSDGYFYGTTTRGGAHDRGTLFRMTPSGELTTIVEFTGNGTVNAGAEPKGSLQRGTQGGVAVIRGTTVRGGFSNAGTFFELLTPNGPLKTVTEFDGTASGSNGSSPRAGLWQDAEGNFYGVTAEGGPRRPRHCFQDFRRTPNDNSGRIHGDRWPNNWQPA
jgi:uncharacterized repeat protein (TIGR03803 family)